MATRQYESMANSFVDQGNTYQYPNLRTYNFPYLKGNYAICDNRLYVQNLDWGESQQQTRALPGSKLQVNTMIAPCYH